MPTCPAAEEIAGCTVSQLIISIITFYIGIKSLKHNLDLHCYDYCLNQQIKPALSDGPINKCCRIMYVSFNSMWFKSFNEKIIPASSGCGLDLVLFNSIMKIKYIEDRPDYFDGWNIDVISIYQWEGFVPDGENFKELFIQKKISTKHKVLTDAHVVREMYLKMESQKKRRTFSSKL